MNDSTSDPDVPVSGPVSASPDSPSRRRLLSAMTAAPLAVPLAALPLSASADGIDEGLFGTWNNWSGYQRAKPSAKWRPVDEAELRARVSGAERLRAVGSGHSFSPLVPTDGALLSLDHLEGLIAHDAATRCATLWAGTRLYDAGPLLHGIGQAMPNLGDIDRQSIAGVLSTATHGTGITLPCIAAHATNLRLVTAQGDVIECGRDRDAALFRQAAVSLGALGVITQVTLQNVPSYRLHERIKVLPLAEVLSSLDRWKDEHRNLDLWVFAFSGEVVVKTLDLTDAPPTPAAGPDLFQDLLLLLCSELSGLLPGLTPTLQGLVSTFVPESERVGWSHQIYPTQRNTRFNEMEYHVPAEVGPACLDEVVRALAATGKGVFFPIEYRYVAADDYPLSPFNGGPRASIAVHQYYRHEFREVFAAVEPILRRYGGRPHWGKLHTVDAQGLHALYPGLADFLRVRAELDPRGKFLNPHLRSIFGIAS